MAAVAACSDADKLALEAFDRDWAKAGVSGDRSALMSIYADEYVGFPGMENKQTAVGNTMIAFERNRGNPPANITYDHYYISCTPMTATITHRITVLAKDPDGKERTVYTRSVHFLERRNGKWQVVGNAGNALDDAATLWYLEQDWNDAVLKRDKAWFDRNYADDFSSISSSTAKLMNKADAVADDTDPATKMEVVETTDMNVRVDGNTAIVTVVFRTKGRDAKGPFDRKIRYTDTWIKRDGRWQAWSSQGTLIPDTGMTAKN